MHTAELVPRKTEFGVLTVMEENFFFTFKCTGPFIQMAQKAASCAILRDHHLNRSLDQAFQRQRTGLCQMGQLPHVQLHGQGGPCSAGFFPEQQALGIINIQAHIRPQWRRQVQIPGLLPDAQVVDAQQISPAGFRLLQELFKIPLLPLLNNTGRGKGDLPSGLMNKPGGSFIIGKGYVLTAVPVAAEDDPVRPAFQSGFHFFNRIHPDRQKSGAFGFYRLLFHQPTTHNMAVFHRLPGRGESFQPGGIQGFTGSAPGFVDLAHGNHQPVVNNRIQCFQHIFRSPKAIHLLPDCCFIQSVFPGRFRYKIR